MQVSSVANMGQSGSKDNAMLIKKSQSQGQVPRNFDSKAAIKSPSGGSDIFAEIRGQMNAIEKSRSRSDIKVHQELQKSTSR